MTFSDRSGDDHGLLCQEGLVNLSIRICCETILL